MKTLKRSLSASSLLSTTSATEVSGAIAAPSVTTTSSSNNSPIASNATIPFAGNINITLPSSIMSTLDTLAAASNGGGAVNSDCINMNSLSSLLMDSMPNDNSKKRRKQSTPIRISETIKAGLTMANQAAALALIEAANGQNDADRKAAEEIDLASADGDDGVSSSSPHPPTATQQLQLQLLQLQQQQHQASSIPRIYLQSLSQLQEKNALPLMNFKLDERVDGAQKENGQNDGGIKKLMSENQEQLLKSFANNLSCDQCGLKLDTEIQLGLHILQEHAPKNLASTKMARDQKSAEDEIPKIFVKKEMGGTSTAAAAASANNWSTNNDDDKEKSAMPMLPNGMKPEDWLAQLSNLPFGFPPEAAVMLSAGYLPQLPLLGVPANPFATNQDGMVRTSAPPLRIFNPEAYCDLCNKEFCNKYFLKTHKANKHNIYEAPTSTSDTPTTSQLTQMSQVFQMQQQQLAAQQQLLSPKSPPQQQQQQQQQLQQSQSQSQQLPQQQQSSSQRQSQSPSGNSQSSAQENLVMCDVCFKRYPNVLAMRRHRSKAHEIPPPTSDASNDAKLSSNATAASVAAATASAGPSTPITMPEGFREDFSIEQEDTTFTPQPRKLSPQSILQAREANFSVDKLKRLGVINPEAFCEICCKEYCNKYFLRTHKIKRHGIYMPLDDSIVKDGRSMANAAVAAASAWQLMQNAPLNLIMSNAEALNQLQNQRKKLEAGEIRKLSIESTDDELEQPNKKRKLNDNDKNKLMDDGDDADDMESKSIENQQDSENISVDLQKLQSMIMQLNDLNAQRPVMCGICGKEQENQFVLHTHMLTEHTTIGDNNNGALKASPSTSPTVINHPSESLCKHCDKELPNAFALSQHMFEVHGVSPASPAREGFVTPERPISGMSIPPQTPSAPINERRPYTITPTSSYCEICNKELCNKYFMKTHMQRMHGIEIENGAQIGGVVCNICNKELCSKYFLRVHKHNTHGIVEDGSPLPQPRQNGSETTDSESMFPSDGALKAGEIPNDLGNRYFSHFTEVCPLCNRRFRGSKWLRTHLLADHGKAGTDKLREIEQQLVNLPKSSTSPPLKIPNGTFGALNPNDPNFMQKQALSSLFAVDDMGIPSPSAKTKEYQCNFCSFSTPSYAFLYIHKRSLHASLLTNEALASLNMNAGDQNDMASQSESAVSIAKDHQPLALKASANDSTSIGNTPVSTPATTPIPIQMPANDCGAGLNSNISPLLHKESPISDVEMLLKNSTAAAAAAAHEQQTTIKDEQQRQDQLEAQNILAEMANITKRPTTYAIPQEFGQGMFMQSFLMEPIDNGAADDDSSTAENKSRFVPSIVFLPVRERIVGKTSISFSLTPA